MKDKILLHYLRYAEDKNQLKITNLHEKNKHLDLILTDFIVGWHLRELSEKNSIVSLLWHKVEFNIAAAFSCLNRFF